MIELVMVESREEVADVLEFYGAGIISIAKAQASFDEYPKYHGDLCIKDNSLALLVTSMLLECSPELYDVICYKEFKRRHR